MCNILKFIKKKELLKYHSSLKIGGYADYFAEPSTIDEILKSLDFAKQMNVPYVVIGSGSNILFDDKGVRGLVIKIGNNFSSIKINNTSITAQSGAWMPDVARKSQTAGLTGLQHTVGIPGSIGGVIVMNGGSQRKSISASIVSVKILNEHNKIQVLSRDECSFGYRESIFQSQKWIILSVTLKCENENARNVRKEMLAILKSRRAKFPLKEPNCGSIFKSSPLIYEQYGPPGKIIEDLGLKGYTVSKVSISRKHGNFLKITDGAKSSDVRKLITSVVVEAKRKLGIKLESEVLYLNENGVFEPIVNTI